MNFKLFTSNYCTGDHTILKYEFDSGAHMQTPRATSDAAECQMSVSGWF